MPDQLALADIVRRVARVQQRGVVAQVERHPALAGADPGVHRVGVGVVAVIDVAPMLLRHDRVVSRSLDNRVGCYVAAEAARLVAERGGAPGDVLALAVAQEETTFAGSRTSAFAHEPDLAIAVDVTFATDQPGVELGPITEHKMGSGPVIARGTTLHPRISDLLQEAAEQEGIPFTLESLGRGTGTDADAIHLARAGIPTGLVSVPNRYMHSPVEMVSVGDVDAAARVIALDIALPQRPRQRVSRQPTRRRDVPKPPARDERETTSEHGDVRSHLREETVRTQNASALPDACQRTSLGRGAALSNGNRASLVPMSLPGWYCLSP